MPKSPEEIAASRAKTEADQKTRRDAYFDAPYTPGPTVPMDIRPVNALEYMAHQMGRIRIALEEINEREKMKAEREEAEATAAVQEKLQNKTQNVKTQFGG